MDLRPPRTALAVEGLRGGHRLAQKVVASAGNAQHRVLPPAPSALTERCQGCGALGGQRAHETLRRTALGQPRRRGRFAPHGQGARSRTAQRKYGCPATRTVPARNSRQGHVRLRRFARTDGSGLAMLFRETRTAPFEDTHCQTPSRSGNVHRKGKNRSRTRGPLQLASPISSGSSDLRLASQPVVKHHEQRRQSKRSSAVSMPIVRVRTRTRPRS